jgi:hypothetical protein
MGSHKYILTAFLVLISSMSLAQSDVASAARANRNKLESKTAQNEGWYAGNKISLRIQEEGNALTTYEIGANQELRITIEGKTKRGQRETGQIMLISGQQQWMLAKNVPMEKGYEIDALDSPVLSLKLAMELLRAAVPGGPSAIAKKTVLNIDEKTRSISVSTSSASGGIDPPWALQATIEPTGAGQWSFELAVKFAETMHITGTWQKDTAAPVFSDDMPLDGWQLLSLGPMKTTAGNATTFDYGAQLSKNHPETLGDLRKL